MAKKISIRIKGDKSLWALMILLSLISLVFVYSSSSRNAAMEGTTTFMLMVKQMRFIILGLACVYVFHLIPLGLYRKLAYVGYFLGLGLLVYTSLAGTRLNEGSRWISLMGVSLQPSEFAKVALVLFVAKVIEEDKLQTFKAFMGRLFAPVGLYLLVILWEGFSTGTILGITILGMLLVSPVKFGYIARGVGIAFGVCVLLLVVNHFVPLNSRLETVESRIVQFVTPDHQRMESDQELYSKVAVATGSLTGKLPGNGMLRHVLPLSNSDYIYSVIVEETGMAGGIVIIVFYLWLLYSAITLARECNKTFSALLVGGLGMLITTQAFVHIGVNVGLLPVTGQTLPLISSGGSSVVAVSISFGMMLSVSRALQDERLYTLESLELTKEEDNVQ